MKTYIRLSAILDGAIDNLDINDVDLNEYPSFSDYIEDYASHKMQVRLISDDWELLGDAYLRMRDAGAEQCRYIRMDLDMSQVGAYEATE